MTSNDVYIGPFRKNNDTFDTNTCVICCEEFDRRSKIIKLNCDHIYHMDCFMEYRNIQVENESPVICAICRQEPDLEKIDNLYSIYSVVDEGYMSDNDELNLTNDELRMINAVPFKQLPRCLGCYKDINELDEAICLKCTHQYHWDCLEAIATQKCSRSCICGTSFSAKIMPNLIVSKMEFDFSGLHLQSQPSKKVRDYEGGWNNLFSSLKHHINVM